MAPPTLILTPDTRIHDLLADRPWLAERLPEISPNFKALKNPVMRNTVGRVATLNRAAAMASMPVERLLRAVAALIEEEEGTGVIVQLESERPRDDRLDSLKALILSLHTGSESLESAKARFEAEFGEMPAAYIARMEQQLIQEGLPVESIQALCDVHVGVMGGGATGADPAEMTPGHPVYTFVAENLAVKQVTAAVRSTLEQIAESRKDRTRSRLLDTLSTQLDMLQAIEKHYLRKEHLLFPILEREGFDGPSKVMWAIHDDIRAGLKAANRQLAEGDHESVRTTLPETLTAIDEMVTKEEAILFPTAIEMLEHEDWAAMHKQEAEIGFAFVERGDDWSPRIKMPPAGSLTNPSAAFAAHHPGAGGASQDPAGPTANTPSATAPDGLIDLNTGRLTRHQLDRILLTLPVELSFVDEDDEVRYYSGVPDKIFPRTPAVIGRKVQNCHPPKSLHLVNQILTEMKAGERETATFWMEDFAGKFVYVRYDAVRDEAGAYMGCLESVQVVDEIREAEGSRRLLDGVV